MTKWIRRSALAILLALGLLGFSGLQAQDVTVKGKIRIGGHKQKLEKDKLYHVKVEAEGFRPQVNIRPGYFLYANFGEGDTFQGYFLPRETRDYSLSIGPDLGDDLGEGQLKYTVTIKSIPMAAKPLLAEKAKLTNQDPIYKVPEFNLPKKCHFKAYTIKLKAKQFYIIDMEKISEGMDPYLYLEDPSGKIVAQDDDSGGDLNARVIFQPRRDGEYRIIATTLVPATGDFRLTVRGQEKQ
ncbi:MAG TPA: PPC domain-containing protein [Gemmataceae bacterium]|nr:PPC domain-containing protein [Gemmataceae bacterium]